MQSQSKLDERELDESAVGQSAVGQNMIGLVSSDNEVVLVERSVLIELAPKLESQVNDSACTTLQLKVDASTLKAFVVFLKLYYANDSKTKQPEGKQNPIVSNPMWDCFESCPGCLVYFLKAAWNLKMEGLYDFASRIGYTYGKNNPRRDGLVGSKPHPSREGCTKCGGFLERKYEVYEKLYGDVGEKARQKANQIEDFENSFVGIE